MQTGIQSKLKFIHILFVLLALITIISSVRWQVINASNFKRIAEGRIYSSELNSLRGSIYAKDGSTLAYSEPRFNVFVWMQDLIFLEKNNLQTREEFLKKVAPIIDKSPDELEKLIKQNYEDKKIQWFEIAKSIKSDQWNKLNSLTTDKNPERKISGFKFQYTSERIYPEGRLASHILGLTNKHKEDVYGVGGIEQFFNGHLNPQKGFVIKESDAIGQAVSSALFATIEPKPGSSVYLTIDKKLQQIVEGQVKHNVERFQADSGSIIVMDPKTGEIMAFANYPDFNPNLREEKDPEVYGNNAISAPYEIGSVGKVFTLAAAIDLGLIKPDTIVMPDGHSGCEEFSSELGKLCTWDEKPQPPMPAWECLVRSDNICFYHIAKKLTKEQFYDYLTRFGIGLSTGVDLAGEFIQPLRDIDSWINEDIAAFSYGHGYLMNTIQAIDSVAAIANKGIRVQPRIVDKIVKGDGEEVVYKPQILNNGKRVVDEKTAETVGEIMSMAYANDIKDYEHWFHDLRNYKIGMKSGTAIIADKYGYDFSKINATQVGFDLSDERKFVMLVRLEKPKVGELSFYNSRIMWLDTFKAMKDYLQVPRID